MKNLNFTLLLLFSLTLFSCGEGSNKNQSSQVTEVEELNPNNLSDSEKDLLDSGNWCKKKEYEYSNTGCIFEEEKMISFSFENEDETYMTFQTLGSTSVNPEDTFVMTGEDGYQFVVECGAGYSTENEPADVNIEQIGDSRVFLRYLTDVETGEIIEQSQFAVAKVSNEELLIVKEDSTVSYGACD